MIRLSRRATDQPAIAIKQHGVDGDSPALDHTGRDGLRGLRHRIAKRNSIRLRVAEGFRRRVGPDDARAQCVPTQSNTRIEWGTRAHSFPSRRIRACSLRCCGVRINISTR